MRTSSYDHIAKYIFKKMTFRDKFDALCRARAKELGRKLTYLEVMELGEAAHKDCSKERKKAAIDERAHAIFNIYPNRQGGLAALKAISDSIAEDGWEVVLERTTQYANAVARWPRTYRYSQNPDSKGKDMVPHASTWFNQRRYKDDPETWRRVGDSPAPKPKVDLPEPDGWREAFPDYIHAGKPWQVIDTASQRYIVESMKGRAHA